ncbi:hypothetical protein BO99DRAFT_107440 [Aspergillus violaceofuscus CBS 115571]|uniref:Uncharacterized protein n=1 Tax=Aspergillus violaceofuscus (strain CBS 115571) TaxID=1450538 RepID=A0A2V5HFE1_ASPV1|nr:hypothetical protein BO99DRAFT_107440 [Aspergillus violaceofuscus CBS 115571]
MNQSIHDIYYLVFSPVGYFPQPVIIRGFFRDRIRAREGELLVRLHGITWDYNHYNRFLPVSLIWMGDRLPEPILICLFDCLSCLLRTLCALLCFCSSSSLLRLLCCPPYLFLLFLLTLTSSLSFLLLPRSSSSPLLYLPFPV